jgi:hypothetical protein
LDFRFLPDLKKSHRVPFFGIVKSHCHATNSTPLPLKVAMAGGFGSVRKIFAFLPSLSATFVPPPLFRSRKSGGFMVRTQTGTGIALVTGGEGKTGYM